MGSTTGKEYQKGEKKSSIKLVKPINYQTQVSTIDYQLSPLQSHMHAKSTQLVPIIYFQHFKISTVLSVALLASLSYTYKHHESKNHSLVIVVPSTLNTEAGVNQMLKIFKGFYTRM